MKKINLDKSSQESLIIENFYDYIDKFKQRQTVALVGKYEWDFGTGLSTWSDEMFEIFGLDKTKDNKVSSTKILELTHPEYLNVVMNNARLAIDGQPVKTIKYKIITPNGVEKTVLESGKVNIVNDDSTGLLAVVQDITENDQLVAQLEQRHKEIDLLFKLEEIQKKHLALSYTLKEVVNILPIGWQYPEITAVRIKCHECEVQTPNFKITKWMQSEKISVDNKFIGIIEIVYLEDKPVAFEGPFLKEERELIKVIAFKIGLFIESNRISEQLKDSEEKFKSFADLAPVGIYETTIDGKCKYVNKKWLDMAGLTLKEALGDGWQNGLHPDDKRMVLSNWVEMIKSNGGWGLEYRFKNKKNGKISWVYGQASAIYEGGKIVSYIGTNSDITYKKIAELEVEKNNLKMINSEIKYRSLFESAEDAIFIADIENRKIIECNEAAVKLTGYTRNELISMDPINLHPKDIAEEAMHAFKKHAKGKYVIYNSEILKKDQKTRVPVSINSSIIKLNGDMFLQGVFRDISAEKNAEKKIKESEEKLKLIYNTSPDAIMTLEPPTWKFTSGNKSIIKMFGVKNEAEFVKLGPWDLSPKYQPDGQLSSVKAKKMIEKAMKNGVNFFEWTHKKYKGEDFFATVLLNRVEFMGKVFLNARVQDIDKRKKIEIEIKENEEKYSKLVESGNDGILVIDNNMIVFANRKMSKLSGYSLNEVIGKSYEKYIHPDDRKQTLKIHRDRMNGKKVPRIYDSSILTKNGKKICIEINASILQFKGKRASLVFVRDIDQRNIEEAKFNKAKETAEKYLNTAGSIIVALDNNGKITLLNKEGYKTVGYKEGSLIGKNWIKLFIPKEKISLITKVHKANVSKKSQFVKEFENDIINKKGEIRTIHWHNSLIKNDNGKIIGTLSSGIDITDRKKSELLLMESQEKYKDLFYNAPVAFHSFGPDKKFININNVELDLLGYKKEELIGKKTWKDLILSNEYKKFNNHWKKLLEGKEIKNLEYTIVRKDGEKREVVLFGSPRYDANGKFVNTRGAIFDITRRKAIERSLAIQKENAQKYLLKLEESNQLKNVFISIASHQLRTPLGIMRWSIEMIMNDQLNKFSPKSGERLKSIYENNIRLISLLEDLLNIGRIEEGKILEIPILVNLNELIRKAIKELLILADEKKIKLELSLRSKKPIKTYIDENHFMDVIYNIVSNSITYTKTGGKVKVLAFLKDKFIHINITDNGAGIPKSEQSKVFEKFFRASNATKISPTGTGLGLAIVKSYVNEWGGNISFRSKLGKGTTFYVKIPIKSKI